MITSENRVQWICGVDEAGRGPLAGPVFAAAVILHPERPIEGLRDSKKLSASRREQLERQIVEHAQAFAVAQASVEEIDQLNILQASLLAMRRAVFALKTAADHALIDGNKVPVGLPCSAQAIVKGDDKVPAISAASILAKCARDRHMQALHLQFPAYGFDAHQGYPTAAHLAALKATGASPVHRKSFGPVRTQLDLQFPQA